MLGVFVKKFVQLFSIVPRSKWTSQVYSWAFKYEQHQFKFGLGSSSAIYSQCWIPWIPIDLQADQLHYPKYYPITHQCQGSHQYSGTSTNHSTVSGKIRPVQDTFEKYLDSRYRYFFQKVSRYRIFWDTFQEKKYLDTDTRYSFLYLEIVSCI